ncbi:MAG TPA: FecR family protein [Oscillatoriaceae cyanobacterium]
MEREVRPRLRRGEGRSGLSFGRRASVVALLLFVGCGPAFAANPIGKVDRVQGEAQGTSGGTTAVLVTGSPVSLNEILTTGPDGRLALTLDDGTGLTLGEKARLAVDRFVYDPTGASTLHADIAGAYRFIAGKLQLGATKDASVTTPSAVIGVRGTDFWGGPIDGEIGVVLLEGSVTVTTATGAAILATPGQGVNINAAASLSAVTTWPDDKRSRALATVTFR